MMKRYRLIDHKIAMTASALVLTGILAGSIVAPPLQAQTAGGASANTGKPGVLMHYRPNRVPRREGEYLKLVWGVDSLSVKAMESGDLIRFTYRVVDPEKAKPLNNKQNEAVLVSPDARVKLTIPSLEKVGQLRQSNTPEAGRSYWMAFSNPRKTVKRGDRVNVDIGVFHIANLEVE